MPTWIRRLTRFAAEHPWRLAAIEFIGFVLLSFAILLVFHRSFFIGLLGAGGAVAGQAIGARMRSRRRMPAGPLR
ncbi:MAG: hypothetical protein PVSMB9_02250 [Candidatus Dormibacteria bacterium]